MRTLGILGEVIGLAATVCRQESCLPRAVYETHFAKLKALMEQGVPTRVYHAYGCDTSESYHFKELGFIGIGPGKENAAPLDPGLAERIRVLGMKHKFRHPSFGDEMME